MRVIQSSESIGTIYRIYRDDDDFVAQIRRLMPFLSRCDGNVTIGGTDDDPDVVLIVGPLDDTTDAAFRKRIHSGVA